MTIDINELRKVIADCYWPTSPVTINEILDRLEAAESTRRDDYQNWMTALDRNAELLAKLEAAEKERDNVAQQLVQSEIGKREISEAHDALQVEVGKLKDLEVARCVKINGYIVDNARLVEEVERLQAKIERMERQEPVAWMCSDKALIQMGYKKFSDRCEGSWDIPVFCRHHRRTGGDEMIDINELRRRIDWGYKVANGVISELLDHLEKAESDALEEARLNGMGAERELALMAKLEAAEKEIALKERVIDALGSELNAVANERDALQAKVNEMEQQEPIGEVVHNGESAGLYDILEQGTPLYALPGAKGE